MVDSNTNRSRSREIAIVGVLLLGPREMVGVAVQVGEESVQYYNVQVIM